MLTHRRLVVVTVAVSFAFTSFAAEQRGVSGTATAPNAGAKKYAVIVGVNRYDDAGIGPLEFAVADAKAIHETLTSAPAGFDAERAVLLTDDSAAERRPTRSNVLKFLNAFIGLATPDDTVLVYFAGHGTTEKDAASGQDRLYLLPADASVSLIRDTSIAYQSVKDLLEACPARRKVMILDACHSAAGRDLSRMTQSTEQQLKPQAEGMVVMAACGADEVSHEMKETGHGAFTHFLLEGFQGGADTNGDGLVGAAELSAYTWEKTSLWAANQGFSQKPWQIATTSGDIVLSKVKTITSGQSVRPPMVVSGGEAKAGDVRVFEGGEFAWIPAGSFEMGDRLSASRIASTYGGEEKWYQNAPRHPVTLTKGFWLGVHEVTNGEFEAFVKATGHKTDAETTGTGRTYNLTSGRWEDTPGASWRNPGWKAESKLPVVLVSWNDAQAYVGWMNGKGDGTYRLQTEAEWEYACRAGTTTEFFWGDLAEKGKGYLNGADETKLPNGSSWELRFPFSDGYWSVSPVGSFKADPWGLYDMHGNALEWCADWYGDYPSGSVTDPSGPGTGEYRVLRGGSWLDLPGICRAACRGYDAPAARNAAIGFRLLRTQN